MLKSETACAILARCEAHGAYHDLPATSLDMLEVEALWCGYRPARGQARLPLPRAFHAALTAAAHRSPS